MYVKLKLKKKMKKTIIALSAILVITALSFAAAKLDSQKYEPPVISKETKKLIKDCLFMTEIQHLSKISASQNKIDSIGSLMKMNCDTCPMYKSYIIYYKK